MRSIFYALMILVSVSAHAGDDKFELCKANEGLAESIMKGRQIGIPMSDSMKIAMDIKNEKMRGIAMSMVSYAYTLPRFQTEAAQARSVRDFANETFEMCFSSE